MSIVQYSLKELGSKVAPVDYFICSASFESRCRSVSDHIDPKRVSHVIVAQNENHKELHSDNANALLQRFLGKSTLVSLDTTKPLKTSDSFQIVLKSFHVIPSTRILVDITTFTHEALLILFRMMWTNFGFSNVTWVYSGAEEYSLGDAVGNKWLSKGIGVVRSVLGYPGELMPSKKLHLIVLVGFEHDRAIELISTYEPSIISLGYGDGQKQHNPSSKHGVQIVKDYYPFASEFSFSCYDAEETRSAIQGEIKKHPNHNVVIAALNTKISTLGAALVALENETVQLCYAQANLYNYRNYSKPGQAAHVIKFDDAAILKAN